MPPLAVNRAPQLDLPIFNRFSVLSDEETEEADHQEPQESSPTDSKTPRRPDHLEPSESSPAERKHPRTSSLVTIELETDLEPRTTQKQTKEPGMAHRQLEISNVAEEGPQNELLRYRGKINGYPALILLDCGSTHDLISLDFVQRHKIVTRKGDGQLTVTMADGHACTESLTRTNDLDLVLPDLHERMMFTVFPLAKYDAILGKPWLAKNNPSINYSTNEVQIGTGRSWTACDTSGTISKDDVQLNFISGKQARHAIRKGEEGFLAWITTEDQTESADLTLHEVIDTSSDSNQRERQKLLSLLNDYSDVFPEELPSRLPPKRSVDHDIDLFPGASPPSKPPYRLSQPMLSELQVQLTALLDKGFIEPSKSPFGAPVFFVKKADGTFRLVCDWRELNRITIKNEACLPNMNDLFDTIQGSRYFSKLDLRSGYNQVRVRDEDVHKTAFNTPLDHFQFCVMGFGLCNAPATFQSLMTEILRPYLRKFVVVFLDDILIFSKNWNEHLEHVRLILQALREQQLFCKLSKCKFGALETLYLGHILSGNTIAPDPEKLKAVLNWPVPSTVSQVWTLSF